MHPASVSFASFLSATRQVFIEVAVSVLFRVDEPVDRLVRHPHHRRVRERDAGTSRDHLRGPPVTEFAHQVGDRLVCGQSGALVRSHGPGVGFVLGAARPVLGWSELITVERGISVGGVCGVLVGGSPTSAPHLPGNRRRRPAQRARDRAKRLATIEAFFDLDTFVQGEVQVVCGHGSAALS